MRAKRRARAASSDDVRRPARVAVEPESRAVHDIDEAAHVVAVDPRQGTLLGFEPPADAVVALTSEGAAVGGEPTAPASVGRAVRGKPAATGKPNAGAELDLTEMAAVAEAEKAIGLELDSPVPVEQAEPAQQPGYILPVAPAEPDTPATPATPAASSASSASSARTTDAAARAFDSAPPSDLGQTVASLQEALLQERSAAQERWRRTRHWLALASAGLVLLFAVSVAQTVALVGFAHRAQAAQQQTQSALNDQQAALTGLASSTSALAARMASSALTGSVLEAPFEANLSPRRAKRVKLARARHAKDKERAKLTTR